MQFRTTVAVLLIAVALVATREQDATYRADHPSTSGGGPADSTVGTVDPATGYHPTFNKIVDHVISVVERTTTPESRVGMIDQELAQLRLTDLAKEIPGMRDDPDVRGYVQKVAECGSYQRSLVRLFIKAADKGFFSNIDESDMMLQKAFVHMVVLDRLTRAGRNDVHFLERMFTTIDEDGRTNNWADHTNSFERVKIQSIDRCIREYVQLVKSKNVPALAGSRAMPMNVVEAVLEDFRIGENENALAGLRFAFEGPGHAEPNPATGAGPTVLSEDGNAMLYFPHLREKWFDGYSMWNAQFCSHYPEAPLFWGKLLAPQVLCYQDAPETYLYNRVIALHLQLHSWVYGRMDRVANPDWRQRGLSVLWAQHNVEMAEEFDAELRAKTGAPEPWLKAKARRAIAAFGQADHQSVDVAINFIGRYVINEPIDFQQQSWSDLLSMSATASKTVF